MIEVKNVMEHQLSSPPTSYEFDSDPQAPHIYFHHRQTYPERLKSSKARIETLEARIEALEAAEASRASAEASRAEISLVWEARTRIARALHFAYVPLIPDLVYSRLKFAGHGFLPPLLSAWAMQRLETHHEPLPVLVEVDDEVMDSYARIIMSLLNGGYTKDMDILWNALPVEGIRLMVNVWLTRPMDRAGIAHPIPTSSEALRIIFSDPHLSSSEKNIAANLIPIAVNKTGVPLFDMKN